MILVVADTSPIHYLILIDAIKVLPRLYDRLILPPAVFRELTHPHAPELVKHWLNSIPPWLEVRQPQSVSKIGRLDPGETEAIALAVELKPASLLLDESEARQEALRLGLSISGTVGFLEKAAQHRLLDLRESFDRLLRTSFRIDSDLIRDALSRIDTRKQKR